MLRLRIDPEFAEFRHQAFALQALLLHLLLQLPEVLAIPPVAAQQFGRQREQFAPKPEPRPAVEQGDFQVQFGEGFRPPRQVDRLNKSMVRRLMAWLKLTRRKPFGSKDGLGKDEYRPAGLAKRLGANRDTVKRWMRGGWLNLRQDDNGHRNTILEGNMAGRSNRSSGTSSTR